MSTLQSNSEHFEAIANSSNPGPFVMLNLIKFKGESGRETYDRYIKESGPYAQKVGAEILYLGKGAEMLYGSEDWDMVMLVKYPSRKAFLQMAKDPGYLKVHALREQALERAVLYATDPITARDIV